MELSHPPNSRSNSTLARLQRFQATCFHAPTKSNGENPNPEQHIYGQEGITIKEWLKGCLITHPKGCLFALVIIVYLIAAVIHFFGWIGDTSMLDTLLKIVGGYNVTTELTTAGVKAFASRGKK